MPLGDNRNMIVKYPVPEKHLLRDFIIESNTLAQCDLSRKELDDTFRRKARHPYAVGHFAAIDYAFRNLNSADWPARTIFQFDNEIKSHTNLAWLRELHRLIMKPIAIHNDQLAVTQVPLAQDCGAYRLRAQAMGLGRLMPKPTSIKKLLHHWYKELGTFHLRVANKLTRPTREIVAECVENAEKFHLMFLAIHPFEDGNGRCGRLVENMLRLRWGMPWKQFTHNDSMKYASSIMTFEDHDNWQHVLISNNAK